MYQINEFNWKHACHILSQPKYAIIIINIICWNISKGHVAGSLLTMITSIGMGTGSLDLNLSFSSLTMNTTTMMTKDVTTSQMLVDVILLKIISRVWKRD